MVFLSQASSQIQGWIFIWKLSIDMMRTWERKSAMIHYVVHITLTYENDPGQNRGSTVQDTETEEFNAKMHISLIKDGGNLSFNNVRY